MNDLIPLNKLFLPENITKSVGKAIYILDNIEGDKIEDKLTNINKKYQNLKIKDISDTENYQIVHSALLDLQKVRVAIQKVGKSWRDNLTAENRKELEIEKQLLSLFEKTETELRAEKDRIDDLKTIEERRMLLPMRSEMLKKINIKTNEDEILLMDEKQFAEHYKILKETFDIEQEQKRKNAIKELHEERYKQIVNSGLFEYLENKYQQYGELEQSIFDEIVNKAKKYREDKKILKAKQEKEQAEIIAKEVKIKAEKEKEEAIKKVQEQAKAEKAKLIENQRKIDEERKLKIKQEARLKEQARLQELEAKEKAEKNKKFQEWKTKNNFNPKTDTIKREENKFILSRIISTIII